MSKTFQKHVFLCANHSVVGLHRMPQTEYTKKKVWVMKRAVIYGQIFEYPSV